MSSTVTAREVTALLSDGQNRKGLIDLTSGILVYVDYRAGQPVVVKPHDNTGHHGWITCKNPDRTVVARCSDYS